jgi:hypothetical protein
MEREPDLNPDKHLIQAGATTIVKLSFFICCTIVFGMMLSKCQLDNEIITACQESCAANDTQMKSVTSGKCVCTTDSNINSDIWVLPGE